MAVVNTAQGEHERKFTISYRSYFNHTLSQFKALIRKTSGLSGCKNYSLTGD